MQESAQARQTAGYVRTALDYAAGNRQSQTQLRFTSNKQGSWSKQNRDKEKYWFLTIVQRDINCDTCWVLPSSPNPQEVYIQVLLKQ